MPINIISCTVRGEIWLWSPPFIFLSICSSTGISSYFCRNAHYCCEKDKAVFFHQPALPPPCQSGSRLVPAIYIIFFWLLYNRIVSVNLMTHKINVSELSCCILLHRLSQNIRHVLDLVMQHFSFGSDWTAESQLSSLPPQRLLLTWQRLVSCTISTFLQLACISRCRLTTVCFCFVLRDPGWDVLVHMPALSDSYFMRTAFLMMLSERYWQSVQSCSAGHLVSLCRNWAGEMALCALRIWLFHLTQMTREAGQR